MSKTVDRLNMVVQHTLNGLFCRVIGSVERPFSPYPFHDPVPWNAFALCVRCVLFSLQTEI